MATSISRAIRRFEQAVRDHEMIGAAHPDDQTRIQATYEVRLRDLCHACGIPEIKAKGK